MPEELKPSIENPFASVPERSYAPAPAQERRAVARPVIKTSAPSAPAINVIPAQREEPVVQSYNPGYYVSQASRMYIDKALRDGSVVQEDVPFVYEVAPSIAKTFRRTHPTLSDIEAGVRFKNLENLRKIAAGEVAIDIVRHEVNSGQPMPVKELNRMWRSVASNVLALYEEKHPTSLEKDTTQA